MAIRLVTFDALHTLITPREPVHVQYVRAFERYLGVSSREHGAAVGAERVKGAFKVGVYLQSLSLVLWFGLIF